MELYFKDRESWRRWLSQNHGRFSEVWLLIFKNHTGKPCIAYGDAVEEAICFGWIDSIVKRVDEERYIRKFTPRTNSRNWSPSNLKRAQKLIAERRMTAAGLEKFRPETGAGTRPPGQACWDEKQFRDHLAANSSALEFFNGLAPSCRRNYVDWVCSAKREETRMRRLEEAIDRLSAGKKLGMK